MTESKMSNPCHLCKYCSQTNPIMAKALGVCGRPMSNGKTLKGVNFCRDIRQRTDEQSCGFLGMWFVSRDAPEI